MDEFILALFYKGHKLKQTTLYQILTGKRSSSVLVYGYLTDLLPVWGLMPQLSEEHYQRNFQSLIDKGALQEVDSGYFQLGQNFGEVAPEKLQVIQQFNNFRFHKGSAPAWRLFRFAVQTASEYQRRNFVPLETAPIYTEAVRQFIRQYGQTTRGILYQETSLFFENLPTTTADALAASLLGYQTTGKADYQILSAEMQENPWKKLTPISWQQGFLSQVILQPTSKTYQLLQPFLTMDFNQSAAVSRQLFLNGANFQQVVNQRKLKAGTISDHVIEWALEASDFPFLRFIQPKDLLYLQGLKGDPLNWRYRELSKGEIAYLSFVLYQIAVKKQVTL